MVGLAICGEQMDACACTFVCTFACACACAIPGAHLNAVDAAKAGEGHAQDDLIDLGGQIANVDGGHLLGVVIAVPLALAMGGKVALGIGFI